MPSRSDPLAAAGAPRRTRRLEAVWALLVCAGLLVAVGTRLESLDYNFDEGVGIQQARLILEGQRPYVDFFYHQPPLYLYTLAAFVAPAPDSLFAYRLLSLLATALCGLILYRIARHLLPAGGALLALVLFYVAPVQYYGLVTLPNALMVLFSTAGVLLIFFQRRAAAVSLGALCLAVAVLYKPLALAVCVAVGLALLLDRERRRAAVLVGLVAGAAGALAWAVFHARSGGVFTELLALQLLRYASRGGFEVMSGFPPFGDLVRDLGIKSAVSWNLYEHTRTFVKLSPYASTHLLAAAAAGQVLLWARPEPAWRSVRGLLTAWWSVPLVFSLFVWEPSWDHYFVQYLPPLALLGAFALHALWAWPGSRRIGRVAVLVLVAYACGSGALYLEARRSDYTKVPRPGSPGESWLTFDPFVNFVSGTRPACGIVDPFNVYGERSLTALSDDPMWSPFHVDRVDLVSCLRRDPEIRIAIGYWGYWFVDDVLERHLEHLDPGRFLEMPLHFRRRTAPTRPRPALTR